MRRIEVILGELERLTRGLSLADLEQETAFTAEAIGFNLGLARNSVSKDLNQLWNDDLAIKSKGRPVFFLHRQAMETLLGRRLNDTECEVRTVGDLLPPQEGRSPDDPFSGLIGYDRSLRGRRYPGSKTLDGGDTLHLRRPGGRRSCAVLQSGDDRVSASSGAR